MLNKLSMHTNLMWKCRSYVVVAILFAVHMFAKPHYFDGLNWPTTLCKKRFGLTSILNATKSIQNGVFVLIFTTWESGYDMFVLWNRPKTSHSSSVDCARELFKGSNESASHLVCTQKKFFWDKGCTFFVWVFWAFDQLTSVSGSIYYLK